MCSCFYLPYDKNPTTAGENVFRQKKEGRSSNWQRPDRRLICGREEEGPVLGHCWHTKGKLRVAERVAEGRRCFCTMIEPPTGIRPADPLGLLSGFSGGENLNVWLMIRGRQLKPEYVQKFKGYHPGPRQRLTIFLADESIGEITNCTV